jgi:hypothetical protein
MDQESSANILSDQGVDSTEGVPYVNMMFDKNKLFSRQGQTFFYRGGAMPKTTLVPRTTLAYWLRRHGVRDIETFRAIMAPYVDHERYKGKAVPDQILYQLYTGRHVPGLAWAQRMASALAARGVGSKQELLWELSELADCLREWHSLPN